MAYLSPLLAQALGDVKTLMPLLAKEPERSSGIGQKQKAPDRIASAGASFYVGTHSQRLSSPFMLLLNQRAAKSK